MADLQNDTGITPLISCACAQAPRLLQRPGGLPWQVPQPGQQLLAEMWRGGGGGDAAGRCQSLSHPLCAPVRAFVAAWRRAGSHTRAPVLCCLLQSGGARCPFCLQVMWSCVLDLNFVRGFLSLSLQGLYLGSARRDGERGFSVSAVWDGLWENM